MKRFPQMMLSKSVLLPLLALLIVDAAPAQSRPTSQKSKPAVKKKAPKVSKKPIKKEAKKPKVKPIALTGLTVWIGDGRRLRNATVLIRGSKIEAVGQDLEIPKDAKVRDLSGKHLSPGFIMLGGRGMGANTPSKGEKYEDSLDPFDANIERGLAVGITSFLSESGMGSTMPAGTTAVIKLIPGELDGQVVKENLLYSMRVPLGPAGWRSFTENVDKARKYIKERKAYEAKKMAGDSKAKAPKENKSLKTLVEVLEGKARLKIRGTAGGGRRRMPFGGRGSSLDFKGCREAVRIARLLGQGVVLDNPVAGWALADEIAQTGCMAIVLPRVEVPEDPTREEPNGSRFSTPATFYKAGIPFFAHVPAGGYGAGPSLGTGGLLGRDYNTPAFDACFAVRAGLPEKYGLATITSWPAKILGIDDRLGTIEAGKDADLLILEGDPLHYRSLVIEAIVNGKVRYRKDKSRIFQSVDKQ
jgi:Amidohydrolase family